MEAAGEIQGNGLCGVKWLRETTEPDDSQTRQKLFAASFSQYANFSLE